MPQVNITTPTELGYGRVWVTGSKSRPGVSHTTLRKDDGSWDCTCEAMRYKKHCRHVNELLDVVGDDNDDFEVNL
jgi:hypothetical protein